MNHDHLISQVGRLSIEHLQLDARETQAWRIRGVRTIGDLDRALACSAARGIGHSNARAALQRLALTSPGGAPDWFIYWGFRGFEFHHLALTCAELDLVAQQAGDIPVERQNFGNAGAMLARAGYGTLSDIVAGLRTGIGDIRGMGTTKREAFQRQILSLITSLRVGSLTIEGLRDRLTHGLPTSAPHQPVPTVRSDEAECRYRLGEQALDLRVGDLHLGLKTRFLKDGGIETLRDLVALLPDRIMAVPGLGRRTVDSIHRALQALEVSQADDGRISWEVFCSRMDIPLLPAAGAPESGPEFVAMLPAVMIEVAGSLRHPIHRLLVTERLFAPPHARASLKEIGARPEISVTREFVRQKEMRLLAALRAALLHGDHAGLDLRFRPGFLAWWRVAVDAVGSGRSVEIGSMIEGLTAALGVEVAELQPHLPTFLTVLTGDILAERDVGEGMRIDPRLVDLSDASRRLPLSRFQLGGNTAALAEHGARTLGDLVDAVVAGRITRYSGSACREALSQLDLIAGATTRSGMVDWPNYLRTAGVARVPAHPPVTAADFLRSVPGSVAEILAHNPPSRRAQDIFLARTRQPAEGRPTLDETARLLGSLSSSVKREETLLLEHLRRIILDHDSSMARVDLEPRFIAFWRELDHLLRCADGDVDAFRENLLAGWCGDEATVDASLPAVIAVLTGYPFGRHGSRRRVLPTEGGQPTTPASGHQGETPITELPACPNP